MRGATYGFFQTIEGVDSGTGFQEGLSLGQPQTTGAARDADDLARQAELRHSGLGAETGVDLVDGDGGDVIGFNGDGHDEE